MKPLSTAMRPITQITNEIKSVLKTLLFLATISGFLGFYSCVKEFFEVEVSNVQIMVHPDPPYFVGDYIDVSGEATIRGEADPEKTKYEYTIIGPDGNKVHDVQAGTATSFRVTLPGNYNIKLTVRAVASGGTNPDEDSADAEISITVVQQGEEFIKINSPLNNEQISSLPVFISVYVDGSLIQENHTALIYIDGLLDSSFIATPFLGQPFSYLKSCLPSGQHEIKAVIRDNGTNGYTRIDSSTVKITVPPGITCETEPEEILTVTITSPENNAVLHSLKDEIKVKAWARDGLSYINLTIGNSGSGYQVSGIEDSLTYTLESFNPEPGINMVIARASDINFNDTYDTIYIDYQPPWQVAATYTMSDYPYGSIGFSYDQTGFIGLGRKYTSGETSNTFYKFDPDENPKITTVSSYPGNAREAVVHFTVGQYTYIGLGSANAGLANEPLLNEFYRFDMANYTWQQMPDFPGEARIYAAAFTLNGKGYVGLGAYYDNFDFKDLQDFWVFDPANATDPWSQVADFPGGSRYKAHVFSVNSKSYVGGGTKPFFTQAYRDLYEFDGNTWTQKTDMPFTEFEYIYEGTGTTLNNFGYVVGGIGYNLVNEQGIWSYDPATNSWLARTFSPFSAFDGEHHFAFVINGIIYCGTSLDPYTSKGNIWSYDPSMEPD